jgi:hypothetical protein
VIHDKEAVEKDEEAGKQRKSSLVLLNRRYTRKSRYTPKVPVEDTEQRENTGKSYKGRSQSQLTLEDKIAILHSIFVDHESYRDAARKHWVKQSLVQTLVIKAKRNKHFLAELRSV